MPPPNLLCPPNSTVLERPTMTNRSATDTTSADDERHLPQARRDLHNAIMALVNPQPLRTETETVWLDSLYLQLRGAVPGEKQHRSGVARSQPPAWIDAIDTLRDIDQSVTGWEPRWPAIPGDLSGDAEPPTVLRLRSINDRTWRPQDVGEVKKIGAKIRGWVDHITTLLADVHVKHISAPCPACGKQTVYRKDSAGELVRQPALQITTMGCVCQACRASWSPDLYLHLARVLGYELPAGVLE